MSAKEKVEFIYNWKFKHFQRYYLTSKHYGISSPSFEIEYLKGIKWNLVLEKYPDSMLCGIQSMNIILEPILIEFQYELTTVDGVVLGTSDVVRHTFRTGNHWSSEGKIKLDDSKTPEEFCLRCRIISYKNPSETSSSFSVVGWEDETVIVAIENTFEWFLVFSGNNEFTAIKKVIVENIPIDVKFEYTGNTLKIAIIPNILDSKFHTMRCLMQLKDESSGAFDEWHVFTFSEADEVVYKFNNFREYRIKGANSFFLRRFNIKGVFEYIYNSLITEKKSFDCDSTAVRQVALTQNKEEVDGILCLLQNLRNMLDEKTYSDVELRVDDEVFFAHKNLLACRSPIFKAMFDQDMLESKTNVVDIYDVESKTFKYFLEYIYTGNVNELNDEIALKLLVVADKYQVSSFTERCLAFLKSALCLDNVLSVLLVADMVNQDQLKFVSIEYIVENSKQVLSMPIWPQWMKENPALTSEIFLKLSKKY